jgi:hypothetical protein
MDSTGARSRNGSIGIDTEIPEITEITETREKIYAPSFLYNLPKVFFPNLSIWLVLYLRTSEGG